jgi:hypothetical protein
MPFTARDVVRLKSGGPKMTVGEPHAGDVNADDRIRRLLAARARSADRSGEQPRLNATTKCPELLPLSVVHRKQTQLSGVS